MSTNKNYLESVLGPNLRLKNSVEAKQIWIKHFHFTYIKFYELHDFLFS